MNVKEWEVKACQIKPHQGECCCFYVQAAFESCLVLPAENWI
jgi:hypothetical protein